MISFAWLLIGAAHLIKLIGWTAPKVDLLWAYTTVKWKGLCAGELFDNKEPSLMWGGAKYTYSSRTWECPSP